MGAHKGIQLHQMVGPQVTLGDGSLHCIIIWVVLDAGLPYYHEVEVLLHLTRATITLVELNNLAAQRSVFEGAFTRLHSG